MPAEAPDLFGLRVGSLFSGYGGIDLAVRSVLGGDVVWHSDVKAAACRLLEQRWPGAPNLGDLTAIDFREVTPVDVLTGGWPCQPHSSAGKRLGADDPRALWPVVARAIDRCRPVVFVGENVARVATNGELERVVGSLAAIGYVGAWRCATASGLVGAPHKRDRLVIVAVDAEADRERLARLAAGVTPSDGLTPRNDRAALLPTPTARDWKGKGRSGRETLPGQPLSETVHRLLPTPTRQMVRGPGGDRGGGPNLLPAARPRGPRHRWWRGPRRVSGPSTGHNRCVAQTGDVVTESRSGPRYVATYL